MKIYSSFVSHKWFHLLQNLLALSNEVILFTGTSWVLRVPWSCEGLGCAVGDLTHISPSLISHKHTLVLNYPSLEHIVNLPYMWQTQHHSDPQPHLSHIRVSGFVICVRLWCVRLCGRYEYYVCVFVCVYVCGREWERSTASVSD